MAATTTRRTSTQWLALVDRQRDSGLSVAEFVRREDLVYQTFIGWCRKAGKHPEHGRRARKMKQDTVPSATGIAPGVLPAFVELGIASGELRNADRADDRAHEWLVELELGGGVTLRVRRTA